MAGSGHERRFRSVHDASGLPPTPERLRQRNEPTLRANSGSSSKYKDREGIVTSSARCAELVSAGRASVGGLNGSPGYTTARRTPDLSGQI